jgi:predicted  nucleic acid-binding Zn-ribbon protein
MAGTSPGFPALRSLSSGSDSPADGAALDAFFDPMSSSPTLPPATGPVRRPTPLPSLTAQSDQRVQAAIAASARAEASLSGLFRAIQHLGSGVGGAREANELLTQELEALRDMLGAANEQQLAFKQKVVMLEQTLERTRKEAERERVFLTDQHDAFIVDLMDEQEGELARRDRDLDILRERLAEIERRNTPTVPPPTADTRGSGRMKAALVEDEGAALDRAERAELERTAQKLAEDRERARETVQRLQAQRDEAQSAVSRISKERDEALQQIHRLKSELGGPRIPLSTRPPPNEQESWHRADRG